MEIKTLKVEKLLEGTIWGAGVGSAVCVGRGNHRGALIAAGIGFSLEAVGVVLERREEKILDQYLNRLMAGEGIEEIMANHKGNGDELRNYLQVAQLVREVFEPVVLPSLEAVEEGKERFKSAVLEKRRKRGLDRLKGLKV